ncbi:hypothetical protein HNS40_20235 [Lentimicrobium sp. S6]|nr:RHS repeat-associated core domain-containing protein [Lentimicrobium sp. S6]NPD47901.1 hypothetical protein [Lentimicrobium sp. S6]
MKRIYFLITIILLGTLVSKAQEQAKYFNLDKTIQTTKYYQASEYINCLPESDESSGFNFTAAAGKEFIAEIDPYLVFPPEGGETGGPGGEVGSDGIVGTNGSFSVSQNGAATYSVGIDMPPGTNGMSPEVGISYSSQSSVGDMGKGWGVNGLSAIVRGARTEYHDGENISLVIGDDCSYSLDGARLIQIDQIDQYIEFRKEINDQSKVIGYLNTSNGYVTHFIVKTKSGLTKEYGLTDDSKQVLSSLSPNVKNYPLAYYINKIIDVSGNYIEYEYLNDENTGEIHISKIKYTGNDDSNPVLEPYCSIDFTYSNVSNQNKYFFKTSFDNSGSSINTKRLDLIESKYNEQTYRKYEFVYETDEYGDNYLEKIDESTSTENYNSLVFDWDKEESEFTFAKNYYTLDIENELFRVPFDFNSDGYTDLGIVVEGAESDEFVILENTKNNLFSEYYRYDITHTNNQDDKIVAVNFADFLGNGIPDIVFTYLNPEDEYKYNIIFGQPGNSFQDISYFEIDAEHYIDIKSDFDFDHNYQGDLSETNLIIDDFDGDGEVEIINYEYKYSKTGNEINLRYHYYTFDKVAKTFTFQNTISKQVENTVSLDEWLLPYLTIESEAFLFDISGNGAKRLFQSFKMIVDVDDYYNIHKDNFCLHIDDDNLLAVDPNFNFENIIGNNDHFLSCDYNSDGKSDIICQGETNIDIWLSDGEKYVNHLSYDNGRAIKKLFVWDYNFDYKPDFIIVDHPDMLSPEVNLINILINNGSSGLIPKLCLGDATVHKDDKFLIGDFDANGSIDIIIDEVIEEQGVRKLENLFLIGNNKPLIKTFKNGFNDSISVIYHSITNKIVYTKSSFWSPDNLEFGQLNYLSGQFMVVSNVKTNSVFGNSSTSYKYANALIHKKGRGFLGFQTFKSIDNNQNISNVILKAFNSDYQYLLDTAALSSIRIAGKEKLISYTTNEIDFIVSPTNEKIIIPVNTLSTTIHCDPYTSDNKRYKWSKSITEIADFDEYGNTLIAKTQEGTKFTSNVPIEPEYENILTSTYDNYTENDKYILGRLDESTIVKKILKYDAPSTQTRNSSYEYYPNGLLKKEILEEGHAKEYSKKYFYDQYGNIEETTEKAADVPDTRTLTTTYDIKGRFILEYINDFDHKMTKIYDEASGNYIETTGPNGLTTSYQYNSFGELQKIQHPDGTQEHSVKRWVDGHADAPEHNDEIAAVYYTYQQVSGLTPNLAFYDIKGRLLREVAYDLNENKIYKDYTYNDKGQLAKESDPYYVITSPEEVNWTEYEYDALSRIITTILPSLDEENLRKITYEFKGLESSVTNPETQKITTTIDSQGKTIKTIDAKNGELLFSFNYENNQGVKKVTDPELNEYFTYYDLFGNVEKTADLDLGETEFRYNGFGEVTYKKDAENNEFEFFYDKLGRVNYTTQLEGRIDYTYDEKENGIGQLSSIDGYNELNDYYYDELGRLVKEITSFKSENENYETSHIFDDYGRPKYLIYPGGFQLRYTYAKNGMLKKIRNGNTNDILWKLNEVNALGQFKNVSIGDNHQTSYTYYDKTSFIKNINTPNVQNMSYSYDDIGNIKTRTNNLTGMSETFVYDDLNRLEKQTIGDNLITTIQYDKVGNIIYKSDVGTYRGYEEDGNGNKLLKIEGYQRDINEIAQNAQYTSFNKVKYIEQGDNAEKKLHLFYGNKGQRIKQIIENGDDPTVTTTYVSDIYKKEEVNGEVKQIYRIFGGDGGILAHYEKTTESDEMIFFFKDHLGSVQNTFNDETNELKTFSYDPWGQRRDPITWEVYNDPSIAGENYGFTGHEHIDIFNLVNMNGRIYDPIIGRFISADPIIPFSNNSQSYNRYSYVLNNPLTYTDPSGHIPHLGFKSWYHMATFAVGVTATIMTAGAAGPMWVMAGSITAIMTYEAATRMAIQNDLSYNDIQMAGLKGFVGGFITGAATHWAGTIVDKANLSDFAKGLVGAWAHGGIQGVGRVIQGGKFEHGFMSGFVSSLASSLSMGITTADNKPAYGAQFFIAAVSGGLAERVSGGSFMNGAMTGVFVLMFNHLSHAGGGNIEGEGEEEETAFANEIVLDENGNVIPQNGRISKDYTIEGIVFSGFRLFRTVIRILNINPQINPNVQVNYKRFVKKIPANSKSSAELIPLENGNFLMQATSPGRVPGSRALYQKWVDPTGKTFRMLKTTYGPNGKIIHVKPK